jgi:predicted nucleotidyltransferase component of viral defense system
MTLHIDKQLYKDAIEFTASGLNLDPMYVEKDYWVTVALKAIYSSEIAHEVIFKGGTSLSKCYKLIKRFSEDIDLVVVRTKFDNDTKIKKKLKVISKTIEHVLPEINIEGITSKHGMLRKTAHQYNKVFTGNLGQVRDVIIAEASSLGNFEPYKKKSITSLVAEMMQQQQQDELIKQYQLQAFDVLVLELQRTLCEKIMSLVRFSHSQNAILDLQKKVRHCYDLYYLLKDEELKIFFESKLFDKLLLKVALDDVKSYKSGNEWLAVHPKDALIFLDPKGTWAQIKQVYVVDFQKLVYEDFPVEKEIEKTMLKISLRLQHVLWKLAL